MVTNHSKMASYGIGDRTYNKSTLIKSGLEPLQEGFVNNTANDDDNVSPAVIKQEQKQLVQEKDTVKNLEGNWQAAVQNYYDLLDKIEDLDRLHDYNYSSSTSSLVNVESKHQKMMKMQYQNDIRNLSEANGNILVLSLIAGTSVAIFSTLLYFQ